jgi:hypothetical protein
MAMDNVRKVTRMGKQEHYSPDREVNEPKLHPQPPALLADELPGHAAAMAGQSVVPTTAWRRAKSGRDI